MTLKPLILVLALLSPTAAAQCICFKAHLDGVPMTGFTPGGYNNLWMPAIAYNHGGRYDGKYFVPVQKGEPAALIRFTGQIWFSRNAGTDTGTPPNFVARIMKNNGESVMASIGTPGSFVSSFIISLAMEDVAQPGDRYYLVVHSTKADSVIDGHPLHTQWGGAVQR